MTPLEKFFAEWDERIRSGANSPLGRTEVMVLEIYDHWLRENGYLVAAPRAEALNE